LAPHFGCSTVSFTFCQLATWHRPKRNGLASGHVDALKPHYQPVLVDAHGHWESDKPHDKAAYILSSHVDDVDGVFPLAHKSARQLPNCTFVPFPRLGHAAAFYKANAVLPHVLNFLCN
jgi:pimeloyl-ACP methyl ester carboxylesterase